MEGSDLIAGAALLVSIFALWNTDRRQKHAEMRLFLRQSLDTATELNRGILHYSGMLLLATDPDDLGDVYPKQVEPYSQEMLSIQTEAARFHRERFFPVFNRGDVYPKQVEPYSQEMLSIQTEAARFHRERFFPVFNRLVNLADEIHRSALPAIHQSLPQARLDEHKNRIATLAQQYDGAYSEYRRLVLERQRRL